MSDNAWLPLPTHDGWWWSIPIRNPKDSRPIYVSVDDGIPSIGGMIRLEEYDHVRYSHIPPPPADAGKLPRRFRWKDRFRSGCGILWPGEQTVTIEYDAGGRQAKKCQWLSDHAAEIEWIDL